MTDDPSIALLASITWLTDQDPPPSPALADWLMEQGSMTRRFERHCRRVTIRRGREGYFPAQALGDDIALLPPSDRYWLREIVLCGDERPWLAGRTLVPENAMNGAEWALTTLGDIPLGRWLFRGRAPERDFIQLGRADGLWARRSCLRPDGKPLLLTELFLPQAPLYC
ncbi:chorismate lyase [Sodalis sp. RH24]|uniref:chorismate lyase n=1 Tax=unclassified Sodalis (in: enterobacteria) TaxID=2636512 RepID=UPI003965B7B8